MSVFNYEKDADGIVTVTMDMTGPVNSMNEEYDVAMSETLAKLEADDDLTGVVLASAKKVFFAGGNIHDLLAMQPGQEEAMFTQCEVGKAQLRRLEKLPVPVVAAINGAALGGGFEICLSCNYRIAYNHKSVQIGLPEVSLGLLPGGGGVVRMVNLLGLEKALPFLVEGKKVTPEKALEAGMIHETVNSIEELVPRAKAYLKEVKGSEAAATNPWDVKGHKIPGGRASTPANSQLVMMATTMLNKQTRGLLPAPLEILDCAVQAATVDFKTAMRVESRGLAKLVTTPEAKNLITTFFFQLNKINGGASRPKDIEKKQVKKVGILGAGMMGQGIAYVSATAGIEVVLKDISQEAADKGKAYTQKLLDKRVERGRMMDSQRQQALDLITPTADNDDLKGCDLIIADDGLQHYRLARDFEFVVVDGKRLFGNGLLLPAGPLRETKQRINHANCVIVNGESSWLKQAHNLDIPALTMQLTANKVVNVKTGKSVKLSDFLAQYLFHSSIHDRASLYCQHGGSHHVCSKQ